MIGYICVHDHSLSHASFSSDSKHIIIVSDNGHVCSNYGHVRIYNLSLFKNLIPQQILFLIHAYACAQNNTLLDLNNPNLKMIFDSLALPIQEEIRKTCTIPVEMK